MVIEIGAHGERAVHCVPMQAARRRVAASSAVAAVCLCVASTASAELLEASTEASVELTPPAAAPDAAGSSETAGSSDDAAFLLAGKVGGIVPLNGLNPFVVGGLQLGWLFAGTDGRIAALLDVSYTAPPGDGRASDARLSGSDYGWELTQKELIVQPTFVYRLTGLGSIVPYAGLGPRIYFLETVAEGTAAGVRFLESEERSTKLGVGLPLGAEYELGPGGLMAELLFEWAPVDHRTTGDASLMGLSLFAGYRARL